MATYKQAPSSDIEHLEVSELLTLGKKVVFGGFCDLYEGTIKRGDQSIKVAIKELRVLSQVQQERYQKHFRRELNVWKELNHPNIVPFLGYARRAECGPLLISPWYENGNLQEYLQANPGANRPRLLIDVLHGMRYLESLNIVHGDLKSLNILVDKGGHACLCDFGTTRFLEIVTGLTTPNQNAINTRRFVAPERLETEGPPKLTSDIWAFGCVVIEVIARQRPYEHLSTDHLVYTAIVRGQSPLNPNYNISIAPGPPFWAFIKRCWKFDPKRRPTIDELLDHIRTSCLVDGHNQTELGITQRLGTWKGLGIRRSRWGL